jgi:hypothetical protein
MFNKATTLQECPILHGYTNSSKYRRSCRCAELRFEFHGHSMLIKLDSRVSADDSIDKSIELKISSLITKLDLYLIWKQVENFLQSVVVF